eukprot:CAMPEP_0170178950 /NCGR_PEP_ID=MMETSP0040_2-20121228/15485_1 /TAXON_ID=641309 /ORGANISM="Lotharella oceanica, Strain CCMP622" /LENGTH=531 /DNA_ID=CAMNT_0010422665 /DNA_START=10 /DNA_END=1605 /DNA_ORIENTATION=-
MAQRVTPKLFAEERGAREEKGQNARLASFVGAMAIADLVKTTLGPKGMDKILQSASDAKKVLVTNDGATILKSIAPENAAAKILIDTSKTQDSVIGDGTTSVAVLAGELLREAERLVDKKIHPQTIIAGWRKAVRTARETLEGSAKDHKNDPEMFRKDLINIARTTISSKILSQHKELFAKMAVDAVLRLKGSTDLEHIHIIKKKGGSMKDSYLDEGFILEKSIGIGQKKRLENAKILVANTPMDTDKIKIFGARVRAGSMASVAEIEAEEKKKMKTKVENILQHGPTCFINRQLIYNYPEQLFTEKGVVAIEHADFVGVERLALVTGAEIASTFDQKGSVKLGHCKLIEEIVIGEDKVIHFSGVAKGEACTVVLRGANQQILDEAERSLHDALCVLSQTVNNSKTVLGGGCSEMLMAHAVDELARKTPGKESLAIEAFARALRQLPTIIADNGGHDSSDLIPKLRACHHNGESTMGLDMDKGTIGDMVKLRIVESFKCKSQVVISAHEAAEMILRVDEIITCAPRQRTRR